MPDVIVVGAGLAGMSAAHRLLERGCNVTLIEQDAFLGGKLGAHQDPGRPDWHEHCYHMYLNWYHNFWTFMNEIDVIKKFVPQPEVYFLKPDEYGRTRSVANVGSPWTYWRNIMSGVVRPPDMMLSGISLADLLGQPAHRHDLLERTSVDGFLTSRLYSTPGAVSDAGRTLAEAFASPSYLSSARSYQSLIKYGARLPDPMMWLLTENTDTGIFVPWEARLRKFTKAKLEIKRLTRVDRLKVVDGRVTGLCLSKLETSPTIDRAADPEAIPKASPEPPIEHVDDVILAIPPGALSRLLGPEVTKWAPELMDVRRLQSEPMIAFDVHFKRRIPDVPKGITILLDSRNDLSFLDTSQVWKGSEGTTKLNVIASDCTTIAAFESRPGIEARFLRELSRFLRFDPAQDVDHCHLQTNVGEALFVNQVGSWEFRPRTSCGIRNLFIAGDYCQTFVDVVTVEGAVVSGLMAAEAVRRRHSLRSPIEIKQPDAYPMLAMKAFATAQMPMAFAAKAVSTVDRMLTSTFSRMFPNG